MKKTPLKRRLSQLKRTPLRKQSKDKAEWRKKYIEAKRSGSCYARPADKPFLLEHKDFLSPHHPFGRSGSAILAFLWMTQEGHDDKHDNGKQARRDGWLQPPFWGLPLNPKWPRPWGIEDETAWPEKYRRKS